MDLLGTAVVRLNRYARRLGKITERNKVDESVVSIIPHWIRPDIKNVISLGEIGRFEVYVSDHAFNDAHAFVTSLELSIRRIEKQ